MISCDCDRLHYRTLDGTWVHDRDEAAELYVQGPPDHLVAPNGRYGPFTPREIGYLVEEHSG